MTNAERIQANNAELQACLNLAKNIVKPSGTLTIDTNGTHDVTAFASVDVNVPSADSNSVLGFRKFNDALTLPDDVGGEEGMQWTGVEGSVKWEGALSDTPFVVDATFKSISIGESEFEQGLTKLLLFSDAKGMVAIGEETIDVSTDGALPLYDSIGGWGYALMDVEYTQTPIVNIMKCENPEAEVWLLENTTPILYEHRTVRLDANTEWDFEYEGVHYKKIDNAYIPDELTTQSILDLGITYRMKSAAVSDVEVSDAVIADDILVVDDETGTMAMVSVSLAYIKEFTPSPEEDMAPVEANSVYVVDYMLSLFEYIEFDLPVIFTGGGWGTLSVTENGKYAVANYESVDVDVKSSGGMELNIAYGDEPPEDTTKLWVKCDEPEDVQILPLPLSGVAEAKVTTLSTTLPYITEKSTGALVGTKVYLFGGTIGNGGTASNVVVFDTETQTITTLNTKLPKAAYGIASAAVGTKVYLFGGSGSIDTINVFDTETEQITTLNTKLPKAAYGIASVVVGTKVYLFGGEICDTINVFDTETEKITTETKLPSYAYGIAAALVGTKVYLFGGFDVNVSKPLDRIDVFDTETKQLTTLDITLPFATSGATAALVGTKVYLFGGFDKGNKVFVDTINVFDTETERIANIGTTLPEGLRDMASAVVGTKVYLFGGQTNSSRTKAINVFEVPEEFYLARNNMIVVESLDKNLFSLLPNMVIGVKAVYLGNAENAGEVIGFALYKDGIWTNI